MNNKHGDIKSSVTGQTQIWIMFFKFTETDFLEISDSDSDPRGPNTSRSRLRESPEQIFLNDKSITMSAVGAS